MLSSGSELSENVSEESTDSAESESATLESSARAPQYVASKDGEWMLPAPASRALACAKGTLLKWSSTGRLEVRINERGFREYKVTRAAMRELISDRRRNDASALLIDVVRLYEEEGKDITEIVLGLDCPSALVAKTLAAHEAAMVEHRQRKIRWFAYELATGDANVPTTWAWVVARFRMTQLLYKQVRDSFDDWVKSIKGESNADISPLVRRVLSSEVRWNAARIAWDRHDCHEVARYQAEQARLRGLDTEVSVKEAEKKSLQVEKGLQEIRHQEQREADRHQRDADLRNEREEKKNRMSKVKTPSIPLYAEGSTFSMGDPNQNGREDT